MNPRLFLLILLFLLFFLFRVQQIGGLERQTSDPELEQVASTFTTLRESLSNKVSYLLPEPQAALLSGMLLGVKTNLPSDFKNALRGTNTIHIVVVSGQNLTLVGGFILSLSTLIGRRKAIILSLIFITFYAFLTGLQVPVIRAALMVVFASIASFLGRERQGWWVLLVTLFLMLMFNPNWLLSISFQLSYGATLGIILFYKPVMKTGKNSLYERIRRTTIKDLRVSLAAQVFTTPIIFYYFKEISLIAPIANVLVSFLIGPLMIFGFCMSFLGAIHISLGWPCGIFSYGALTYMIVIIKLLHQLPLSFLSFK